MVSVESQGRLIVMCAGLEKVVTHGGLIMYIHTSYTHNVSTVYMYLQYWQQWGWNRRPRWTQKSSSRGCCTLGRYSQHSWSNPVALHRQFCEVGNEMKILHIAASWFAGFISRRGGGAIASPWIQSPPPRIYIHCTLLHMQVNLSLSIMASFITNYVVCTCPPPP